MNAKYVKCAAKCCGNTLLDNSNLTFFTFPENTVLAKIWAANAKVSYYYYGSTLCSDHFENKFFNPNFASRSVFRQDIEPIPTIFNIKGNKNDGDGVTSIPKVTLVDPAKIISKPPDPVPPQKEYCRLCANLFSITNLNTIFFKYNEMIETCLPGKVFQDDPLSQYICLSCTHKVKECAKMIKAFQEADKKLHEMLNPKSVTQKQPSTSKESEIIDISDEDDDDDKSNFNEKDLLDDLMNVLTETNNILDEIANDPLDIASDNEEPESQPVEIRKKDNYETKTKNRFQCLKCSKLFDYKEEVLVHAYHEHPYSRNDKIISRIVPQKVQVLKVEPHRNIKYHCIACNIIYNTKDEIFNHSNSVHNGNKSLSKIIEVAEIPQKTLTVKYMCLSCPTIRDTQLEIRRHASLYHSGTKIISKAIICDKEFSENAPVINNAPFMKRTKPIDFKGPSSDIKNYHSLFNEFGIGSADHFHALYARKPKIEVPIINYNVKYKCNSCSEFRDSYNEIYDHFEKQHSNPVEQTNPVAIVCKVKEDCDLSVDNNPEYVIQINDGTITDIDPSEKQERLKYSKPKLIEETGFKCLDCKKIYRTKQILVSHALAKHPNELNEINCKQVTVQRRVDYTKGKNRFECLTCSTLHISKFSLLRHTELLHPNISKNKFLYRFLDHQKRGPFQCLRCSYSPKTYSQYCRHTKTHICFKCKECDKKFMKANLLKEHEKEHNPTDTENTWTCFVCEEEFTNKSQLLRHENTHKTLKDVQCSKCKKVFISDYHLKKHENKAHETCLCDVCGKTYELPYIKHHLQTHNTDCTFKCKHCSKMFRTASILFRHQRKHYTTTEKTMCQICGKVLGRSSLTLHMKTHSTEKDEVCDICGASFHRRDHLRLHRARHATEERTRTFKCEHCFEVVSGRKSYIQHLSDVHEIKELPTEKKKFQCTICDKQFPSKTYLADHIRWHKGEKIYPCDTCGKTFGTRISVYQHKLTHLPYEQYKYQCNICNKRFKRNEQYRNHRRVHTGEKPFPCPICQRPFRVRGEMVKHMRVHTPKENRDIRIKSKTKPKETQTTIITQRTLETVRPEVIKTYVRPKIQTVVRPTINIKTKNIDIAPINIKTDNIFESKNVLHTKKVKIAKVETGLSQTIFYLDDSSSDSAEEVGRNDMPALE